MSFQIPYTFIKILKCTDMLTYFQIYTFPKIRYNMQLNFVFNYFTLQMYTLPRIMYPLQ